ncbi:MAG: NTPase [Sulfolobales archaeon]
MKIFISGRPGVGKTTVFMKTIDLLKKENVEIVGFYCPEVRERGMRIGFKIIDMVDGEERWLALVKDLRRGSCEKTVGKYCLVEEEASQIARKLMSKINKASLIAIDEVGPMELKIEDLRRFIEYSLSLERPGLYVVHERIVHDLARKYRVNDIFIINESNRSYIAEEIYKKIMMYIRK